MELFLNKKEEESKDLRTKIDEKHIYDVLVLGAGPAGLTAALYALRKKMDVAIVGKDVGGQLLWTWDIENYLGFKKIPGFDLSKKFEEHVVGMPVAFEEGSTVKSIKKDDIFTTELDNNKNILSKTVIIATGKKYRPLGVPGEEKYTGKGVAYCATCDAPLFSNKAVAVVGGGNSGVEAALELAKIASSVKLIEVTGLLIADQVLQDKLYACKNVEVLLSHQVKEIKGDDFVKEVIIEDMLSLEEKKLDLDGIFVEIGLIPNSDFEVSPELKLNDHNEIIVDNSNKTNIEGLFAAGDVSNIPEKQVIIATGEGAKAALGAHKYLAHK